MATAFAVGCAKCPAPVQAGLDTAEPELRVFLHGLIDAARSKPCSGLVRGQLAMAYDANGFVDAAAATYAQAAALDDDPRWPYHLAIAQAARSDFDAAIDAADSALAIDPGYPPTWLWRGLWLLDLDQAAPAAQAFANALDVAKHPAHVAAARVGAARASLRLGEVEAAGTALEAAAAGFDHPHIRLLLRRARQRAREGAQEPAGQTPIPLAGPMRWPDPRRDGLAAYVRGLSGSLALAAKMLDAGRARSAAALLEPLLETYPENVELANDLGIALRLVGREQDALALLAEGLRRRPDYAPFHFNFAILQERLGETALAERHLREALKLNANLDGGPRRLANILVRTGRVEEARAILEQAAAAHPVRAELRFFAGMVAGTQGDWPAAVAHLDAAARAAPNHDRAQLLLATALAEVGEFAAAAAARDAARRLGVAPDEIETARAHAESLQRTDRDSAARR